MASQTLMFVRSDVVMMIDLLVVSTAPNKPIFADYGSFLELLHLFYHSHRDYLLVVHYSKSSQRRILTKDFQAHWLLGSHQHNSRIALLYSIWAVFKYLASHSIDFTLGLKNSAGN